MSFVGAKQEGVTYAPGYFLAHEECERVTKEIPQNGSENVGGRRYVKAGAVFPANDATAIGLLYEDVDVTTGDMPGSVVISGTVYEDRLPETLASAAKEALQGLGFKFVEAAPTVTRPEWLVTEQ